jgi:hypothetical protein
VCSSGARGTKDLPHPMTTGSPLSITSFGLQRYSRNCTGRNLVVTLIPVGGVDSVISSTSFRADQAISTKPCQERSRLAPWCRIGAGQVLSVVGWRPHVEPYCDRSMDQGDGADNRGEWVMARRKSLRNQLYRSARDLGKRKRASVSGSKTRKGVVPRVGPSPARAGLRKRNRRALWMVIW